MERIENDKITIEILESQKGFLKDVGLWASPDLAEKYRYRLSPDALPISVSERQDLQEIADSIYAKGGFLDGAIKLYDKTLIPQFSSTKTGGLIRKALTAGIGKDAVLQEIGSDLPFICRLDLISVNSDNESDPTFQIAEVEGDKTHGFGYLSIMDAFGDKFISGRDTPGILQTFLNELGKQNIPIEMPIALIVGLKERFYLQELKAFEIFARNAGVNLFTVQEDKVKVSEKGLIIPGAEIPVTTLVNIPSLTPLGLGQSGIDAEKIYELYKNGDIKCLIPPKRFLGSKGLLALVSNGDNNQELENVLTEVFDPNCLATLRKFIPTTILITKKNKDFVRSLVESEPENWVIKQTVSSGMKGVALPDNRDSKEKFISTALDTPFSYIIQRKVNQKTRSFRFAEPGSLSIINSANMYMRVELFCSADGISTVGVTAREEPSVHGAKDAIQIPVLYE